MKKIINKCAEFVQNSKHWAVPLPPNAATLQARQQQGVLSVGKHVPEF